jgi:hypothetical protein
MEEGKKNIENNIQLAENEEINEKIEPSDYIEKRKMLDQTKINKQIWSIKEVFQKIGSKLLILNPEYQRREVWGEDKKIPFIESLFMGITIPPIYVVEIPPENVLAEMRYEVVDGKQRLTTILNFIQNELELKEKYLEYYGDLFDKLNFSQIEQNHKSIVSELLSSVLDVYVISANSPEFTKYDIFSRLNKGAQSLRINEIRKAIYRSHTITMLETHIEPLIISKDCKYHLIFSDAKIKRYEDYGVFFSAITFYLKTDEKRGIVTDYKSRPRELINSVLSELQVDPSKLSDNILCAIIENTIKLKEKMLEKVEIQGEKHLIDSLIYFAVKYSNETWDKINEIITDKDIIDSLNKSPTTTSNVNSRIKRISEIIHGKK